MSVNTTTNYNGADAGKIYEKIIAETDVLAKGLINVKSELGADTVYVRLTDVTDAQIDYTDDFVGGNSINLTEIGIPLTKLTFQLEYGIEELKQRWGAELLNGRVGEPNAQDEHDMVISELNRKLSKNFGANVFYGNPTVNGQFKGLLHGLTSVEKDMNTPAEVVTALQDAITATPSEIRDADDFIVLVSKDIMISYARAMELRNFAQDEMYVDGYKLEWSKSLQDGTILTYHKENAFLGCDLEGSHNLIIVSDLRPSAINKMRLRADSKYGASFIEPTKVVWFTKA